jgi:membrane-bound metal-dependent hydrolase YbcI (DUF457 family)
MFIGHFAVALAAKRGAPRTSLGWLFAACQLPDLIWPVLLLAGVERARIATGDTAFTPLAFDHYPWSHSLLLDAVWATVLGLLYWSRAQDRRGALAIAALVMSHWILDWVTHRPDLPLAPPPLPGSDVRAGLGLWNSVPATLIVELALFTAGVWLYGSTTRPRDRTGRVAFAALVVFLLVVHGANAFGPPPPSMTAVAIGGLAIWLLVWWGAWIDAHRDSTALRA